MPAPTIVAVAPNGAYKTRDDHPQIPLTAAQLAREAEACQAAGAGMLHLHVREYDGRHSLDAGRYREAIAAIREQVGDDLLLQVTSEAGGRYSPAQQRQCVRELMPEAVSLALRELMADKSEAKLSGALLRDLIDNDGAPQIILYHPDELHLYRQWQQQGVLPPERLSLLLVIGRYRPATGTPPTLRDFLELGLTGETWMVCAFGTEEFPSATAAVNQGGHVRVGFENNLLLQDGRIAQNNAELVHQLSSVIKADGGRIAESTECREMLRPRPAADTAAART